MSDYVPPYGSADPNASYVDRNNGGGVAGSRVPGLAIEMPQREIRTVLVSAGLTPDENDPTQLNEAIDQKIALATGGGDNPLDDLLTLLRARLRIYPEILTSDGKFNLTVPSTGTVQVPAGIVILHRGVFPVTTALQSFATSANKTYHLRYRFTGTPGWSLVDFSDAGYNGGLVEDNAAFDTGYDDMISHRIVTDASNVATITALENRHELSTTMAMTAGTLLNPNLNLSRQTQTADYNWARSPKQKAFSRVALNVNDNAGNDRDENLYSTYPTAIYEIPATRYRSTFLYGVDFMAAPGASLVLSIGA